ncbi:unnamed protein product [Sphagnum jensenii]|uniref:EF-hand domain-containing protein n=1 Tax=Sphagnum jensenii TaxID=128206 RepID=A0ABP0VF72_9BRYO
MEFYENFQMMQKTKLKYSGNEALIERAYQSRAQSRLSLSRSRDSLKTEEIPVSPWGKFDTPHGALDEEEAAWLTKTVHHYYSANTPITKYHSRKGNNNGMIDSVKSMGSLSLRSSTDSVWSTKESTESNNTHNNNNSSHTSNTNNRREYSADTSKHTSVRTQLTPLQSFDFNDDAFVEPVYSPRTKYLGACIRENIIPIAKLVLRKNQSTKIDLSHSGLHDKLGKVLSEYLEDLPNVESIDISGNALTDVSLPLLIHSFQNMPNLKYLNLSRSKIDDEASTALADYLANPLCPLISLVLQNADIDDYECARFISCLKSNYHLRELDMSSNLLGSAEIFHGSTKIKKFTAGGMAIAEYIASKDCRLHTLKLGWNSIKMASSLDIAKSISVNETLLYLDLSYNGLGEAAGEYIGDALQRNQTLQTLLLENNHLNGRACYCICAGILENTSLTRISLDKNPIGEFGAKSIIQVINGLRELAASATDPVKGLDLFLQADTDGNGTIDRNELTALLDKFGFPMDQDGIDDIFDQFDVDGAGVLEKEEFLRLLALESEEAVARTSEYLESYFYADHAMAYQRYILPRQGILHLSVVDNYSEKGPKNILTSLQAQYMLDLSASIRDSLLICDVIQQYQLRYTEALQIFKTIHSETGNIATALATVLPRMAFQSEARALLNKAVDNDLVKMARVKKTLGSAYQPLLGCVNGFYRLNLSVETDRLCLTHLLGHSKSLMEKRLKFHSHGFHLEGKVGDTSQHGNWTCFRNELYNGESFQITSSAFTPMKRTGILEFDFSSCMRPPLEENSISDFRVVRILANISLLESGNIPEALKQLADSKTATLKSESQFATMVHERSMDKACKIGIHEDIFYTHLKVRGEEQVKATRREILTTEVAQSKISHRGSKLSGKFRNSILLSESLQQIQENVEYCRGVSEISTSKADKDAENSLNSRDTVIAVDYYAELKNDREKLPPHIFDLKKRLTDLVVDPRIDELVKVNKILEAIIDLFAKVYIRCRHMVLILKCFKFGSLLKTPYFGTYNVELVVALFLRIVDLHNFDIVLHELSAEECAAIYCRIGWLNIFNPCKVDGGYELQLSQREERIIIKVLVTLSVAEPCQNILNQQFQWDRSGDIIPGWDLTEGWKTNEGIPVRGILRLQFASYGVHADGNTTPAHQNRVYRVDRELRRVLTYCCLVEMKLRCGVRVILPGSEALN